MKKLFIILLRKDIKLLKVTRHSCNLEWLHENKSFLVNLFDDGKAFCRIQGQNRHYLTGEEILLFSKVFLIPSTLFTTKRNFTGTHFELTNDKLSIDESFYRLHKELYNSKTISIATHLKQTNVR